MLNGKGLKTGELLFPHLDGTVLWYHNIDLVIQLGKIAATLYLLWDCIAYFDGKVVDKFSPGNHTLFVAEVVDAKVMANGQRLSSLDYNGVYLGKN